MGLFKRNPAKQLVKAGDVEGLLSLADSSDESERADALNALPALEGAMTPEQRASSRGVMTSALSDSSPDVRGQALFALWETEGGGAVERVIGGLGDPDVGVRCLAAAMLGGGDPSVATDPLIASLQDGEPVVRQSAADSLGALGDRRAEAPLDKVASDDPEAEVRAAARSALDQLGAG
ncbi:MAG: HEAT repeat domain-containing protein [Actinomycetota bacterium]